MSEDRDAKRPGPPSTLDEVRRQLVHAAAELLYEVGTEVGLGTVRLSDVIERANVPRATAYRSLADAELDPQELLRRDVVVGVLARNSRGANFAAVEDAVGRELEAQVGKLSSDDVVDRTAAFRAIIRRGSEVSFRGVAVAPDRRVLMAVMSAVVAQPDSIPQWQRDAILEGEAAAAAQFDEMYSTFAALFGYGLKPDQTMAQFATAAAAVLEGLCLRYGFNDELDGISRPSGAGGETELWTLYGMCFEGIFLSFFEPIDADDPFADLANY